MRILYMYSISVLFGHCMKMMVISNKLLKQKKILVIDDNTSITFALSKFFKLKKLNCVVVNDGRNALELIKNESFDSILLDLAMPDFTGYDIINELEKENMLKDQKIIVLTATSLDEDSIRKLTKRGIHSIHRKPMDVSTLIEVMSRL